MSAAVLERPAACGASGGSHAPATLDATILGAWAQLAVHESAACLVCHGLMQPRYGASGPAPVGGRCRDCGSTLG